MLQSAVLIGNYLDHLSGHHRLLGVTLRRRRTLLPRFLQGVQWRFSASRFSTDHRRARLCRILQPRSTPPPAVHGPQGELGECTGI